MGRTHDLVTERIISNAVAYRFIHLAWGFLGAWETKLVLTVTLVGVYAA
jgi:hypothetical protein